MSLRRSGIEYLDYSWNPVRGCHHTILECAVADRCWAREMATRFHQPFGYHLVPREMEAPFPRRPGIIGVCFTGDLFGAWVPSDIIERVRRRIVGAPEHRFLFLTKNPRRYAEFSPWPPNAWLGASITGAETDDVQAQRAAALRNVDGGHHSQIWLSLEPLMGRIYSKALYAMSWLVVGGFSGRWGVTTDQATWCTAIEHVARQLDIPIWHKSNLIEKGQIMRPALQRRPAEMKP